MDMQTILKDIYGFIVSLIKEIKVFFKSIEIKKNFEDEKYFPG